MSTRTEIIEISDHAVDKFKRLVYCQYSRSKIKQVIKDLIPRSKGVSHKQLMKRQHYERDCGYRTVEYTTPDNRQIMLMILIKNRTVITIWTIK